MVQKVYLKCLICIKMYPFSYASRRVQSTDTVMLMLDEASAAKGSKKEAAAAPGLGYVDLPNTQIRKVKSMPWSSSNVRVTYGVLYCY